MDSRAEVTQQAVQDTTGIAEAVKGKWWRPEELGIIDYSQSVGGVAAAGQSFLDTVGMNLNLGKNELMPDLSLEDILLDDDSGKSPKSEARSISPKAQGSQAVSSPSRLSKKIYSWKTVEEASEEEDEVLDDGNGDGVGLGVDESEYSLDDSSSRPTQASPINGSQLPKTARCKSCGAVISRDIEAIEEHTSECPATKANVLTFDGNSLSTLSLNKRQSERHPDLDKSG